MSWIDEYHVKLIALEQNRDKWAQVAAQLYDAICCCGLCADQAAVAYKEAVNADRGHA